jgi:hypothetical protein
MAQHQCYSTTQVLQYNTSATVQLELLTKVQVRGQPLWDVMLYHFMYDS